MCRYQACAMRNFDTSNAYIAQASTHLKFVFQAEWARSHCCYNVGIAFDQYCISAIYRAFYQWFKTITSMTATGRSAIRMHSKLCSIADLTG
jgi:hypothetical protein